MKNFTILICLLFLTNTGISQTLNLPGRQPDALTGSQFATLVWNFTLTDRENAIYAQIMSGNIPDFQRNLVEISFSQTVGGTEYNIKYYVLPDYLAVGSDSDYFLIPMTPVLAQKICNNLKLTMPTRKMVDQIWSNAEVKLAPSTIPPSPEMTTIPVMWQHNQTVWGQRQTFLGTNPLGDLVGGNKKDIVISNRIYGNPAPNRVVIYGWHYQNGTPIQPLYAGHSETYADYSHGVRLVQDSITINGQPGKITSILQSETLHLLFSDEGRIPLPYYPIGTSSLNPPSVWGVISNGENSLRLVINNDPGVTHYLVHLSNNGINFANSILLDKLNPVLNGLNSESIYYIKLQAVGSDTSNFSEVLAGIPATSTKKVLIVNGFDRSVAGNTYDFIRMHAAAVKNGGLNFESATNEALTYGLFNLGNYDIVDWILGAESTVNETFSTSEQNIVAAFLNGGGALFVSGSEIAWDLDSRGTAADKNFIWNYLKSQYILDAPNNQPNVYYSAQGVTGTIFEGVTNITYDNGSHGTYNVSYPDVINGINGGKNSVLYTGVANNFAGVEYKGLFPSGTTNGALVFLGFPFETIYPESKRLEVMSKIIEYFDDLTGIQEEGTTILDNYHLSQNFPNPFNPATKIRYTIPVNSVDEVVTLTIYDVLGREIAVLVNEVQPAGNYELIFEAMEINSGVYFYQLKAGSFNQTRKMTFLK
ncbi:MAG: T9SS type A sorting domain-containing protein [Ignavibacteriaceae bacterium]|nr:T9SS type A sorting domain-containing protein [Ignavibacteriaceae bacterium]